MGAASKVAIMNEEEHGLRPLFRAGLEMTQGDGDVLALEHLVGILAGVTKQEAGPAPLAWASQEGLLKAIKGQINTIRISAHKGDFCDVPIYLSPPPAQTAAWVLCRTNQMPVHDGDYLVWDDLVGFSYTARWMRRFGWLNVPQGAMITHWMHMPGHP